jgi:glycogen debranching enzyme
VSALDERGAPTPWTFAGEAASVDASVSITLVHGTSFVISRRTGDMRWGVDGVYVGDTRICHRLVLRVDGEAPEPLAATIQDPWRADFVGRVRDRGLIVRRSMRVGSGLVVDLSIRNTTWEVQDATIEVEVAADLADLFAVKELRADGDAAPAVVVDGAVVIGDRLGRRAASVHAHPAAVLEDGCVRWTVRLEPGAERAVCLELLALRGGAEIEPAHRCGGADGVPRVSQASRRPAAPDVATDVPGLAHAYERSVADLDALRITDPAHPDDEILAAGAPWFMTLFGRDSILSSWMALLVDPGLALATARTLARLQGVVVDPEREEEVGKVLHEVRPGHDSSMRFADGSRYFGSVDATPLFVMIVHELWRWGIPLAELRPLLPHVDAALAWMAGAGDANGDGYLDYERSTGEGLANQGWKDSWDGISFADGRLPEPPISLCEVQGYAYAAWRAGGDLAEAVGDHVAAATRRARAVVLREAFHRDFWLPERGWFALALDGAGRPVDALASNMGHCLWTGIVEPSHASAVARWLADPVLASGWGVRTLATTMARYDPLSYHNGSVWPHDSAICIAGLRRYGYVAEAMQLATGLIAASGASGGRLPELFSGLSPEELPVPVPYPASCSPQAWASAAPLLVMRSMLGFEPSLPQGIVEIDPVLPEGAAHLAIHGVALGTARVSVEVDRDAVALRGVPRGVAVVRPAATDPPDPVGRPATP